MASAEERFAHAVTLYYAQEDRDDAYTCAKVHPEFFDRLSESSRAYFLAGCIQCYGFLIQRDPSVSPNEVWFHSPHRPLGYRVSLS